MNVNLKTPGTNLPRTNPALLAKVVCLAAAVLLLFPGAQTSLATGFNLFVSSTVPWFDTGIDVTAGTLVNISASGTVIYGTLPAQTTGPDGGNYAPPQYFSDAVLPTTYIVSLIGKIGGTTAVGTGTPVPEGILGKGPGFVGSSYSQIIPTSGRLFLGFNDRVPSFGDNSGSFTANVTVPEPSTVALATVGGLTFLLGGRKARKQISPHHR